MDEAKIISLRKEPELLDMFCTYFSKNWGREVIYRNCMESSLSSDSPLPQWFLGRQTLVQALLTGYNATIGARTKPITKRGR